VKKEPVLVRSGITAAAAILVLLVAFNVPITDAQQDAILGAIGPVALLVLGLWSRPAVMPNSKVVEYAENGKVIAGPGNEHPTGAVIRNVGSLDAE
jgi:hypothetical protein